MRADVESLVAEFGHGGRAVGGHGTLAVGFVIVVVVGFVFGATGGLGRFAVASEVEEDERVVRA